jgi:hypothetical protein
MSTRESPCRVILGGDEEALSGTQQDYYIAINFKVKSSADDPASVLSLATAPPAVDDDALAACQAKEVVARRQSLFSLAMSAAVGGVAWSANAPCLPLLAGMFAVVGVSICSVSRCTRRGPGRRCGTAEPQPVPPRHAHLAHAVGRRTRRRPAPAAPSAPSSCGSPLRRL